MHGYCKTAVYNSWRDMNRRCDSPSNKSYHNYGGRGITVCERWRHSFINFLEDMGDRPKGFVIDRIDNNKGYSPDNCHWVTQKENMQNIRTNHNIEYDGMVKSKSAWAEYLNMSLASLSSRLKRGWSMADIVSIGIGEKIRTKESYHSKTGKPYWRKGMAPITL